MKYSRTAAEILGVDDRLGSLAVGKDADLVVMTGDPYQIDNPYIDSTSNGLSYSVERFKNQSIAAHVTLSKGERSPLAELAANVL